ncbi:ATP-binding cassette domain-containing protein [Lacticaseibacillus jixiensis]|uniref:ATP-binding cassette domain-containing protein n=1 Tax=Lacticaseibacillus jixiensis TaxID=3231926 RepID=UPI0036F34F48
MYVEVEHYTKNLRKHKVLNDINVRLDGGHIYGIYGRNGSGKSMLLRAISGLILPSSGSVSIDGKTIGDDIDFPESMGLIIENVQLQRTLTAKENLSVLAKIKHVASPTDIDWALSAVGLDANDSVKIRNYSLGMNQKLAIAQAIFEKPDLILLDEPTNALDFQTVVDFRKLIQSLVTPSRIIVIATHSKEDLLELATDFLEMVDGKLYPRIKEDLIAESSDATAI